MSGATGGAARLRLLWERGLLARIRPLVDHTILEMRSDDGLDTAVMRDARADLLPPSVPVSRETSRALLARLAAFHEASRDEPSEGLCPIGARYAMFAPASIAPTRGRGGTRSQSASPWAGNCSLPVSTLTLDLVCLGSLAQMGFRLAVSAFASGPDPPLVAASQLTWWTGRARAALDRLGPL